MSIEYHDFLMELNWSRSDMTDGFYAIPLSFTKFNEKGEITFEFDEDGDEIIPTELEGLEFIEWDEDDAYRLFALLLDQDDVGSAFQYNVNGRDVFCGHRNWLVVTDSEADYEWERELDRYLDECVLSELHGTARDYFDRDRWKSDAKIDGRAHSLARYDGTEGFESTQNGTYYIYRQN